MIIYERNNNGKEVQRTISDHVQAALNDEARLTLREFNIRNDEEIMIVLSQDETRAIFNLMNRIANLAKTDLPF